MNNPTRRLPESEWDLNALRVHVYEWLTDAVLPGYAKPGEMALDELVRRIKLFTEADADLLRSLHDSTPGSDNQAALLSLAERIESVVGGLS
jgi:hypothetical protein